MVQIYKLLVKVAAFSEIFLLILLAKWQKRQT